MAYRFLVTMMVAAMTVVDAQPRRGPPRGPIKEDKSTFFGKEGDAVQREGDMNTYISVGLILILGCAVVYALAGGGKSAGKAKAKAR